MSKFALTMLLFNVLFSANLFAQTSKVDSSEMVTLRIDPESSRGAAVSQVFEEVNFIPLETTKESLFGSISQLEVTESSYVIWDYDTKSVLIFNKEGKFKAKIDASKIEKDPNNKDGQVFWGFALLKENGQQVIQISAGKYYIYFDLNGKVVRKVPSKGLAYGDSVVFTEGTAVKFSHLVKKDKDSVYYDVALIKDKATTAQYFPYTRDRYKNDQIYGGSRSYKYGVEDELFFISYYEYNIYKIKPSSLSLSYRVIFPANNSLPVDFKSNPVYKGKRQEYFEKNPNAIYGIGSVYKVGNNLYFKTDSWTWNKDKKNALIYNLKTSELTSLTNLEPDTLSSFLPVTDAGFYYDFLNNGFHMYDGQYFYTSYSSLAMFAFKDQNADKNPKYSPILANYFKTGDRKSNPILIQLKPKKD